MADAGFGGGGFAVLPVGGVNYLLDSWPQDGREIGAVLNEYVAPLNFVIANLREYSFTCRARTCKVIEHQIICI
ncbi:hypothetical protein D3C87_1397990 [compost metagenome]